MESLYGIPTTNENARHLESEKTWKSEEISFL